MEPPLSEPSASSSRSRSSRTSRSCSGELVPKAVALQKAEALAVVLAVPLDCLGRFSHPIVWLLQVSANAVLRLLRVKPAPAGMIAYTREDIRHSVAAAEDVGELHEAEEEMLYKVFDFASKEVSAVMVPRPEVVGISVDMPPEEALARRRRLALHALPGLPRLARRDRRDPPRARSLRVRCTISASRRSSSRRSLRPAFVVPETKDLAALLADFRREKQHMAIVIDEYGDDGGDRHARGPARGDRRRDRGRVRPSGHVDRADRRHARSASTARTRSTTSTRSSAPSSSRRTSTRWPGSSSARSDERRRSATRSGRWARADRARGRGLADPADRGRVRRRRAKRHGRRSPKPPSAPGQFDA